MTAGQQGVISAITPIIRDLVNDQVQQTTVVTKPEWKAGDTEVLWEYHNPIKEPSNVHTGNGESQAGFVFTKQPDAFVLENLTGDSHVSVDAAKPSRPRGVYATATMRSGVTGEAMEVVVTWAAPVVDTANRWLEYLHSSPTGTTVEDSLAYYTIQRTNQNTGEVSTVGIVSHSKQVVSRIRTYLENEAASGYPGATTDPRTHVATINPALFVEVTDINGDPVYVDGVPVTELLLPPDEDAWFTFKDTTAVYGTDYTYTVTAVNGDQQEGVSVTAYINAYGSIAGVSAEFGPAWCSTYPVVTGGSADGRESYANFTVVCGAATSDIELWLVPVMDNALAIDTSAPVSSEPTVVETIPAAAKLWVPGTGTSTQAIEFIGRNIEACGGLTNISFGSGTSLVSNSIQKTAITGSTTDYRYTARVTIASTANLGPRTGTFTCGNGKTATTSMYSFTRSAADTGAGPTFDYPGDTIRFDTSDILEFSITGINMSNLSGFTVAPIRTSATITTITDNYVSVSLTPFVGTVTLTAVLKNGCVSTGKDKVTVVVTADPGGNIKDPTGQRGTATSARSFPTIRVK